MKKLKRFYWKIYYSRLMRSIQKIWRVIKEYWGFDDSLAFLLLLIGLGYYFIEVPGIDHSRVLNFYRDIHSELIGIGVTILIITNADQAVRTRIEKRRLIVQMGSHDNGFALEAVRQMKEMGWFHGPILEGISLSKANLKDAEMDGISLKNADLSRIILEEANLNDANLSEVNLELSNLKWVAFGSTNLKGANLSHANLENAYLDRADLEGANLSGAILENANLRLANLERADLYTANLKKTFLGEANLKGANFSGADLRQIRYNDETTWVDSCYDDETIWPDGFDPDKQGSIKKDRNISNYQTSVLE